MGTLWARISNSCARTSVFPDLSEIGSVYGARLSFHDRGLQRLERANGARLRAPGHDKYHPDSRHGWQLRRKNIATVGGLCCEHAAKFDHCYYSRGGAWGALPDGIGE